MMFRCPCVHACQILEITEGVNVQEGQWPNMVVYMQGKTTMNMCIVEALCLCLCLSLSLFLSIAKASSAGGLLG